MSGQLSLPLSQDGPLVWMAQSLQARIQQGFPANLFDFAFMPSKPDRAWFKRYVKRTPCVILGWNGTAAEAADGGIFAGIAHWTVALVTRNSAGPMPRYLGDALAPGLFAMTRVATILLHGWLVDPDGTPWTATGTTIVSAIGNLYNEDWGDEDTAIAALDLHIAYEETLPDGLEQTPSVGLLTDAIAWDFGEAAPLLTQTIDTSLPNGGN